VLRGGRIFDLIAGELIESDVAICNDRIVGTLSEYPTGARPTCAEKSSFRASSTRTATSSRR
jgi:adenine deaminase